MDELVREAENLVPWDYTDAVKIFPWITCTPVEWNERDPWQNLVYLVQNFKDVYKSAAFVCSRLANRFSASPSFKEMDKAKHYLECFHVLHRIGTGELGVTEVMMKQYPNYSQYFYMENVEQAKLDFMET